MAKELKEGLYIAQGPETNVLIRFVGTAPMLEIKGAIDLNEFYKTGTAVNLAKDSVEVLEIMSCPEKYNFEKPSITDAIQSEGIDQNKGKSYDDLNESDFDTFVAKYKELRCMYNSNETESKFLIWLRKEHNVAITTGKFIISKIKASFQRKPLKEQQHELD